jgi:hypothetical protein
MPALRSPDVAVYGMAAMDDRGRITDRLVLRSLGWIPGTSIHLDVIGDVAVARPGGPIRITAPGHLRLPATVRHQLGLRPGDRVLLVARPATSRLLVYPATALDALLAGSRPASSGGPA